MVALLVTVQTVPQGKKPSLVSLKNTTKIAVVVDLFFSDKTQDIQKMTADQKILVPNFLTKKIEKIIVRSEEKDKNGNLYEQVEVALGLSKQNVNYLIGLQIVPSRTVPATKYTEEFVMPETQKLTCNISI
jgi:hypothetical protein